MVGRPGAPNGEADPRLRPDSSDYNRDMRARSGPDVNRLSVVSGIVCLVFAAGRYAVAANDSATLTALAALAATLAGTGAVTLMRRRTSEADPPAWLSGIVPAAAAAVLALALAQLPVGVPWWLGLAGSAALWPIVVLAEYVTLDAGEDRRPLATQGLGLLTYLLVFVLFTGLAAGGARAAFSATSCGALAGFMACRLFALNPRPDIGRAGLYALAVGLLAAEAMWAMSYWRVRPVSAAAVGLALFYVSVGILGAQLQGRLRRRLWLEYGIVGLLALLVAAFGSM